jgi:hypothetical protein
MHQESPASSRVAATASLVAIFKSYWEGVSSLLSVAARTLKKPLMGRLYGMLFRQFNEGNAGDNCYNSAFI